MALAVMRKSSKLPQAAALMQILKRCSSLRREQQQRQQGYYDHCSSEAAANPSDVPRGHFVVYVGQNRTRHIIPIMFLDRPEFQTLLQRAEEEFGFDDDMGLTLPCEDVAFRSPTSVLR